MSYTLKEKFGDLFAEMVAHSKAAAKIDETKVYEEANPEMRKYMFKLLDDTFSADSGLGNLENFKDFYEKQYSLAIEFLNSDPLIVKNGNETYLTMVLSVIIILTFVSFIIYFLIPLFTKNNATLAQLMLKIGLARKITNSKPKRYHILIRYLMLYLIYCVLIVFEHILDLHQIQQALWYECALTCDI